VDLDPRSGRFENPGDLGSQRRVRFEDLSELYA
jgi:hypothetical protein